MLATLSEVAADRWVELALAVVTLLAAWLRIKNTKFRSALQIVTDVIEGSGKDVDTLKQEVTKELKLTIQEAAKGTKAEAIIAKAAAISDPKKPDKG